MNDDVKAAVERFHTWEFDGLDARDHAALLAHIDGEPARIAAAREEQRASDAEQLARIWYGLPNAGRADHGPVAVVRSTPLTATPLADEIAALRARVAELEAAANTAGADASAAALRAMARATKAEAERDEAQRGEQEAWRQADQMRAERDDERDQRIVAEVDRDRAHGAREVLGKLLVERDALRAQVEALERERDMLQTALRDNSAAHSETGKALLRAEAQVEAARAECERILDSMYSAEYRYAADHVLAAMDGAKP